MSAPCVAIQLKNQEFERRLEEMERRAGFTGASSPCVAIQLKNQELERRLEEIELRARSTSTSFPCVAIQLKNQELEWRREELERKARSNDTNSPCIAIQVKNQELERRVEEIERKAVLHKLENQALEGKLAELEKGSSRVISSPSGEIHQKNEELERKVADLQWKFAGLIETKRLKKLITASQELDLAFLVDATGSMENCLNSIKGKAEKIAAEGKKAWPQLKLRVAFAPYRDYDETAKDNKETCNFTDDFEGDDSKFAKALSRVEAVQCGINCDTAEDVFPGLERVARLEWKSRTHVLVHIGDAPCHGKQFHDLPDDYDPTVRFVPDEHPGGDKHNRPITTLLSNLREDCQIIRYLFCHLNRSTEKMLSVFKNDCGDEDWIQEEWVMSDLNKIEDVVVTMSSTSISQSIQMGESGLAISTFGNLDVEPNSPQIETILCEQATEIKYNLDDLFDTLATNGKLEMKDIPDSMVQIGQNTFSRKESISGRYNAVVYQPRSAPRHMVLRRFKTPIGEDENEIYAEEGYFEQMEVHTVAAKLAEHFNIELESHAIKDYTTVQFTLVSTLKVGTRFYNMEKTLMGKRIKYDEKNLNSVTVKEYAATLDAFSHWTYHRSKGLLVVNDLQGLEIKGTGESKEVWLCNSSLHCKDALRYRTTKKNWGEPGMKRFLETHKCSKICHTLKLPSSKSASRYV